VSFSFSPAFADLLVRAGGLSSDAGGELRGGGELHRIHLVAGVGSSTIQAFVRIAELELDARG
jgi:hypothetical protein